MIVITIKDSLYFVYDGINSQDMGIMNVNLGSELQSESFLPSAEIHETHTRHNAIPHFHKIKREPLIFNLVCAFEEGVNLQQVQRWLMKRNFKELYFSNAPEKRYFAMYEGMSRLSHTGREGYFEITFCTNSPYASSELIETEIFDCATPTLSFSRPSPAIHPETGQEVGIDEPIFVDFVGDKKGLWVEEGTGDVADSLLTFPLPSGLPPNFGIGLSFKPSLPSGAKDITFWQAGAVRCYYDPASAKLKMAYGAAAAELEATWDAGDVIGIYGGRQNNKVFIQAKIAGALASKAEGQTGEEVESGDRLFVGSRPDDQALEFDGVDDYVDCGAPVIPEDDFSIEVWCNPMTLSGYQSIVGQYAASVPGRLWFGFEGYKFGYRIGASSKTIPYSVDGWQHLAITRSGSTVCLYISGHLVDTSTVSGKVLQTVNTIIGACTTSDGHLNGDISDVRIWNTARTQEQIQVNMHRTLTGNEPGLVGYWPLNEGTGNIAHDFSGNDN